MNNIVEFKRATAPHPAAMAAAQLLHMNGLPVSDLLAALAIWDRLMEEEEG